LRQSRTLYTLTNGPKSGVHFTLRLNFQASAERVARLEEQTGFKNLAGSNKKDEATRQREIDAGRQRQQQVRALVQALAKADGERLYRIREDFVAALRGIDRRRGVRLSAGELKAVLGALGERDETAEICRDRNGNPEPDSELRDTETVPLKEDVEAYFRREVLPHVPDAWIDHGKTKIGYEIPVTRHFYRYEPPRPLAEIEADIKKLEGEIVSLLGEIAA
jgi:type I restriction enzyme M protein